MMSKNSLSKKINLWNIWICVVIEVDIAKNSFSWKGVIIVSNYTLPELIRVTFGDKFII